MSLKTASFKSIEKGKEVVRTMVYHEGKATLTVNAKSISLTPKVTVGFNRNKAGELEAVRITVWLTLSARELGLSGPDGEIDVRITMKGSASADPAPKKKKN